MTNRFGWSLPPGVRHSDIPGNRPEDLRAEEEWDSIVDLIPSEFDTLAMLIGKIKTGLDTGSLDVEEFQNVCVELVNFCDTHDLDLGFIGAGIEDAGTWTHPAMDGPEYDPEREFDGGEE